jgi:hypothetical protein
MLTEHEKHMAAMEEKGRRILRGRRGSAGDIAGGIGETALGVFAIVVFIGFLKALFF